MARLPDGVDTQFLDNDALANLTPKQREYLSASFGTSLKGMQARATRAEQANVNLNTRVEAVEGANRQWEQLRAQNPALFSDNQKFVEIANQLDGMSPDQVIAQLQGGHQGATEEPYMNDYVGQVADIAQRARLGVLDEDSANQEIATIANAVSEIGGNVNDLQTAITGVYQADINELQQSVQNVSASLNQNIGQGIQYLLQAQKYSHQHPDRDGSEVVTHMVKTGIRDFNVAAQQLFGAQDAEDQYQIRHNQEMDAAKKAWQQGADGNSDSPSSRRVFQTNRHREQMAATGQDPNQVFYRDTTGTGDPRVQTTPPEVIAEGVGESSATAPAHVFQKSTRAPAQRSPVTAHNSLDFQQIISDRVYDKAADLA